MCGIVAYVGNKQVVPLLLEGLKRLEYRGYDSAGVAVITSSGMKVQRAVGRVSVLESQIEKAPGFEGCTGIAHTRWATHGSPSVPNAHPHSHKTSDGYLVSLVHNGIIENYVSLRKWLEAKGHKFTSETDTEVIAVLIAEFYKGDLEAAVKAALREVTGAYAIAVICEREPHTLICARKGSPLIIGIADKSYVVASDASAIVSHTTQVITLDDYQVAKLCAGPNDKYNPVAEASGDTSGGGGPWKVDFKTTTIDDVPVTRDVQELEFDLAQIELGQFEHFMHKEIMEQPESIRTCLRGRIDLRDNRVVLGGLASFTRELVRARHFILTAQGTAFHAGLIGEYLLEDIAKVPARCHYASEFRYRNPIIEEGSITVAISQSGETADTLAALREAKDRGSLALGVVNVVGSSIARETDAGVYLHVGPEIGVASTKAFLGQVLVLTLISLYVGRRRYLSAEQLHNYLEELERLPDMVSKVLEQSDAIRTATEKCLDRNNWLFLGRGYHYPVAVEGALKLKELSYIHAEGMPAAEMKHGPIALIDKGMPVVFVATQGSQYDKVISNIEEVRARGGRVIAVATEGDTQITRYSESVFYVPHVSEALQPMLTVVPLQLVAYHAAVLRGHDVDKPRNLAKSVTVE
ncbi:MAG: glutamine--fructose-6-phosphate transaminase (isomerizing) [Phycisphaera sp.]|nr:glutamine--fructose-6-phosphate transaminase (isomerizing) [Phycisphaera sp.]